MRGRAAGDAGVEEYVLLILVSSSAFIESRAADGQWDVEGAGAVGGRGAACRAVGLLGDGPAAGVEGVGFRVADGVGAGDVAVETIVGVLGEPVAGVGQRAAGVEGVVDDDGQTLARGSALGGGDGVDQVAVAVAGQHRDRAGVAVGGVIANPGGELLVALVIVKLDRVQERLGDLDGIFDLDDASLMPGGSAGAAAGAFAVGITDAHLEAGGQAKLAAFLHYWLTIAWKSAPVPLSVANSLEKRTCPAFRRPLSVAKGGTPPPQCDSTLATTRRALPGIFDVRAALFGLRIGMRTVARFVFCALSASVCTLSLFCRRMLCHGGEVILDGLLGGAGDALLGDFLGFLVFGAGDGLAELDLGLAAIGGGFHEVAGDDLAVLVDL